MPRDDDGGTYKFSVNFRSRKERKCTKSKRTAGALKPFNFLPNCTIQYRKEQNDRQFGRFC